VVGGGGAPISYDRRRRRGGAHLYTGTQNSKKKKIKT